MAGRAFEMPLELGEVPNFVFFILLEAPVIERRQPKIGVF